MWKRKEFVLALCQMKVTPNKQHNIDAAHEAVEMAAKNGADIVVLPERWNWWPAKNSKPDPKSFAETIPRLDAGDDFSFASSPSTRALRDIARGCGVTLIGGSILENDMGRMYNTCCALCPAGRLIGKHRKVHLFDIDIPGKITYRESDTVSPGSGLTLVDVDGLKIGLGICYDIRFPEMAMLYARSGAKLIVYPGGFPMSTGERHWELLLRSRALDNQVFVAGCSRPVNPELNRQAWGHSMVVGPWGQVLAKCRDEEATIMSRISTDDVEAMRASIPVHKQMRHDLYELSRKTKS